MRKNVRHMDYLIYFPKKKMHRLLNCGRGREYYDFETEIWNRENGDQEESLVFPVSATP